jgi:hypothetical protein
MDLSSEPHFFDLLSSSYARLTQRRLLPDEILHERGAAWLYHEAPFCLLAHNRDPDPRFIYANKAAQDCFEYSWDALTALPSRLSAEAINREERQRLLDKVAAQGYATDYRGVRIARSGRRFWIEDGTVWQLIDGAGLVHGQAAMFSTWRDA